MFLVFRNQTQEMEACRVFEEEWMDQRDRNSWNGLGPSGVDRKYCEGSCARRDNGQLSSNWLARGLTHTCENG